MKSIVFRSILILAAVFIVESVVAQSKGVFQDLITNWTEDPELISASVGFYAVDLKTGSTLDDWNGRKAMIPASLMKVATTITALEVLGPQKTFDTELTYTGFIEEGVLYGNLVLRGNGDPTFGSLRLGERPDWLISRFAEGIKRLGIHSISGDLIIDMSAFESFVPGTWSWEDIANYYAAIPQPLNFLENQFSIVFSTGTEGTPAKLISVNPEVPGLEIVNEVRAGKVSGDQTFCYGHPFGNRIEVRGLLPENQRTFSVKAAIPDPARFFAEQIMKAAERIGVEWQGSIRALNQLEELSDEESSLVFRYTSPTVAEIVGVTNTFSVNFFAEALLSAVGGMDGGVGGIRVMEEFWSQNSPDNIQGIVFKDGSGLSHYNALSAAMLVDMLVYAHGRPYRDVFEQSLPEVGKSGSLKTFGDREYLQGRLRAKSGYMTGHRGYAGYLTTASGRKMAFAIIVNHYDLPSNVMREKIETLLEQMAKTG